MWIVRCQKQKVYEGADFRKAINRATSMKGTLTYKP